MISTTLAVLGEPNRLRIVEALRSRPRPVAEIVDRVGLGQPQVSKHLRVLRDAGLVAVRARARQRFYALKPAPFRELNLWLGQFKEIWDERYDQLDALLVEMQAAKKKATKRKE